MIVGEKRDTKMSQGGLRKLTVGLVGLRLGLDRHHIGVTRENVTWETGGMNQMWFLRKRAVF